MQFTVSQNEWAKVLDFAEKLLYVGIAAAVDYLAANYKLLPFSPWIIGIIAAVIYPLKLFLDGKITA